MKEVKIELKNVYKIFGNSPKKALSLLKFTKSTPSFRHF
ncbi:hypothetical protein Sdel_0011 [Sulfurospirillum deleyianum DSM 6946]|uniref:Uncharacterized protein n=1 Tax=Sulfurospirillum deleyianum (strain ATCC 51133 / DSM 6946 / 5175) TaxID=525898 RepID=D1B0Q5_SULD5|nr:hypothetical protein Sdel_0011 [Sulfurospirillum deleyianum DSM 6946]